MAVKADLLTVYMRVNTLWKDDNRYYLNGKITRRESNKIASVKSYIAVSVKNKELHAIPSKGDYWKVTGSYSYKTEEYGSGFARTRIHFKDPVTIEQTMPNSNDELIDFIAKRKEFVGIGDTIIRDACDTLQEEMLPAILNKDVGKLRTALSERLTNNLLAGFEQFDNLKHSLWLAKYRIPPFIQQKIFKLNKSFDPKQIEDNPYDLITLGLTFEEADEIAVKEFKFKLEHPHRLIGAVNEALKVISKWGHTVATHNQVMPLIMKRLKLSVENTELARSAMSLSERKLNFTEINGRYHHGIYFFMEKVVTMRFKAMLASKAEWTDLHPEAINKALENTPFPLATKQVEAVFAALESNLAVIIGGAGTGKTTVLRSVLRSFKELGYEIHPIALAGRATMRLREAVGFKTSTIARFLNQSPLVDGKNVVVIDEASMVDLATMFRLVLHCSPSVRFILVGDDDQLASIGVGLILSDLVRSSAVPVVELDIIQRQESTTGIPAYSAFVRQGIVPEKLSTANIHFHECNETRIVDVCARLYGQDIEKTQIITATNNMKDELNQFCQSVYNNESRQMFVNMGDETFMTRFRQNDPVMFTKNDYDADVQNGTLAKLVEIDTNELKGTLGSVKVLEKKGNVGLTVDLLNSLDLAYAITLHKGQGSQYKRVIVAVGNSNLIDRSWIYTAITRAEVELHLVGTRRKLTSAIQGPSAKYTRQTYLAELLSCTDSHLIVH